MRGGQEAPVGAKLDTMLFDARLTKTRHTSLAQGVPRPLFALTCPASAITFFKLPPTAAVL